MTIDPAIRDHQAWLGYLQPDGLVVSPAALVDAQVILDRNVRPLQDRFLDFIDIVPVNGDDAYVTPDLPAFFTGFLEWPADLLHGLDDARPLPDALRVAPQEGETLEPTFAFANPAPADGDSEWLLLVKCLDTGTSLDERVQRDNSSWSATHAQRFERLLRLTGVTIGLITNGTHIRLIAAPPQETAGSLTFPIGAMTEVAGRPILGALHMLLDRFRLLSAPTDARLPALLKRSRDYQGRVSTALAQQVLGALYELLSGFQAANEHTNGDLLRQLLEKNPNTVYEGLLTTLMRLVFLLYAEDRGLMPGSDVYVRNYSVHGLFERLRDDNEHFPDTMDHRYGAWAQLLALFHALYAGCKHPALAMPPRSGYLFDPDRFPFLAGTHATHSGTPSPNPCRRIIDPPDLPMSVNACAPMPPTASAPARDDGASPSGIRAADGNRLAKSAGPGSACGFRKPSYEGSGESMTPRRGDGGSAPGREAALPLVSDGTVFRVLRGLLVLDGERLSYRTLDVERIGSVYETMIGFDLRVAEGATIAIKPAKSHGAPVPIDLDALLAIKPGSRDKWLQDHTDQKITGKAGTDLKKADTLDELLAALDRKIARNATPHILPAGAMVLVPTDERRRSGSHYTPRSLTGPIVETTLRPILDRLPAETADMQGLCPISANLFGLY